MCQVQASDRILYTLQGGLSKLKGVMQARHYLILRNLEDHTPSILCCDLQKLRFGCSTTRHSLQPLRVKIGKVV
jgi:hypothetical protein